MRFWRREAMLQIGGRRCSIDNLRFSFEVTMEDKPQISQAKITVYNLSADTRGSLKDRLPVILAAGYQGNTGTIFVGQITKHGTEYQDVDIVTRIDAMDSIDAWLGKSVNKTYKPKSYAADILGDLLGIFGVEVSQVILNTNCYYPRGKVCTGKLKDVLKQIVVDDCKSRLLIRNGQIIINPPAQGVGKGFLLSPHTGLIRSPKRVERRNTDNGKDEPDNLWQVESLLNYNIGCGDLVSIKSKTFTGTVRVTKCVHTGARDGDYKSVLEVRSV